MFAGTQINKKAAKKGKKNINQIKDKKVVVK